MTDLDLVLLIMGGFAVLIGGIWLLKLAFEEDIRWGLGVLFVPFVYFIFVIRYWNKAGKPFFINLSGVIFVVAVALIAENVSSNETSSISPVAFNAVKEQIDANAGIQFHFRNCPSDIAQKAHPFWRNFLPDTVVSQEDCGKDIESCYKDCINWRNEDACLELAQIFEDAKPVADNIHAEMLYAEACALGSGGGCTNRAAGIRNGQFEGDPMLNLTKKALGICYFRTFQFSCGTGDSWGCAMLGQSYQVGEGVEPSLSEARRNYLLACEINSDFPSCDFAHRRMKELENNKLN